MNILIACEYSALVRSAFELKGHYCLSCDLLDTEIPGNHYKGDIKDVINEGWDRLIAFPPCTDLAVSGARYFAQKIADGRQKSALNFVSFLLNSNIPEIALENPIGVISSNIRKPDQIIQPWMFGHGETKATCLWLKNLPKLTPTNIVSGREHRIWKLPPSLDRAKLRSKTYTGIANAMAEQWK